MNRRQFHASALSSAAISALPLSSAAATSSAVRGPMLAWAKAIAQAQNRASPALLAQQLKIPLAAASGLYDTLLQDGVIRAPVAGGLAKAAKPMSQQISAQTGSAPINTKDLKRAWDTLTKSEPQPFEDTPPPSSFE